jgi:hypothetical protein
MFQVEKERYMWPLRHCAARRKVALSIPDGVIGIFDLHNPSGRTMTLGSNLTLTEMRCKGGQCVRLTNLPPSCTDFLDIYEAEPPGTLRACPGLYRDCFNFGQRTRKINEPQTLL